MEDLLNKIDQAVESEDISYEMGCLISAEFTPAPDPSPRIIRLINESEFTIDQVIDYCLEAAKKEAKEKSDRNEVMYWQEPYGPRMWMESDYPETHYYDLYAELSYAKQEETH